MQNSFLFVINSVLFGVGLAMDAFCVSAVNGLNETKMPVRRMCLIAGVFALFQAAMPLIGWTAVRWIEDTFRSFQKAVPWIALLLLLYIGGKMLYEGIAGDPLEGEKPAVDFRSLLLQGIATSIDALSVGFTIANYRFVLAFTEALIIGAVTFVICLGGIRIGKHFGSKLAKRASLLGGVILIAIGIEIFVTGVF
ncbi:MAG: manganese efflux pump MntP family protein [Erysipelotrichaceae bacterium]|nr:manganese efflux pump MntP family protein [Erysipelotrichaceae bacterium]